MIIYKQKLTPDGATIPHYNGTLHVAEQNGVPTLWYLHDETQPAKEIVGLPTRYDFQQEKMGQHVGSCLCYEGRIVCHFFEAI